MTLPPPIEGTTVIIARLPSRYGDNQRRRVWDPSCQETFDVIAHHTVEFRVAKDAASGNLRWEGPFDHVPLYQPE